MTVMDSSFAVRRSELILRYRHPPAPRRMAFGAGALPFAEWRDAAAAVLADLLAVRKPTPAPVRLLRSATYRDVTVRALVMRVDENLSLPAYLLSPTREPAPGGRAVLAIHGHGEVEPCVGLPDAGEDYHHRFALALAQAGHVVLCPELRGFGTLRDLADDLPDESLEYWRWGEHMAYTLVTDGFQHGRTLLGDTVEDLLRWEDWLAGVHAVEHVDVAGISYGADLALTYPVFSSRVRRIFASGGLGSFEPIFSRCRNAPAHCIPGILRWLDRCDIAGLNAPRPIAVHYGELDVPGPGNNSAAYNESVPAAVAELRRIYEAAGAADAVSLVVSLGRGHEMDVDALTSFLGRP